MTVKAIKINDADNIAVALYPLNLGDSIELGGITILLKENIPQGHKFAISNIEREDKIIKYGFPIGHATSSIKSGEWVHIHNLHTDLSEHEQYTYNPNIRTINSIESGTFMGYVRNSGEVGIRNEIWIIPASGCVNDICEQLAKQNAKLAETYNLDGIYAFPHPYGCSQMGEDHKTTQKLLSSLCKHPNAGGVLVVALGCENNTIDSFKEVLGEYNKDSMRFMVCQDVENELETGTTLLIQLAAFAAKFKRQPISVSKLVVGMKCGGSDGLSGITANPVVGAFSDLLIAKGGSTLLTEVPEMFGAEGLLMNRAINKELFESAVNMIKNFKHYYSSHNQVVYDNPSPGNKQGGVSTLEDKSLGCVQKGGTAPISDVINYTERIKAKGLTLLSGPGNDLVSATALAAAGAQIILFTTGRGTPFGAPVPTIKISSNTNIFNKKNNWIDFDAGCVANGKSIANVALNLMEQVLCVAEGKQTKSEVAGYRGIAIFKDGVTL